MCLKILTRVQRVKLAKRSAMEPPEVRSPRTPEKDAGFCSGGDDDDSEESNRSNSDDSGLKMGLPTVVKQPKNKRKCVEPIKLESSASFPLAPLKKRIRYDAETPRQAVEWDNRVPPHPAVRPATPDEEEPARVSRAFFSVDALLARSPSESVLPPPPPPPREQRNYKNMTRERRIEANARERTRVHTISAAFDTLRRSIPAYSHNQKLSKLSVLRIACSYILALSKVAEGAGDEGAGPSTSADGISLADCVESVSKTIQTEGKLRKRRDDA